MGALIGDREVSHLRQEYYTLLASVFFAEPLAELLEKLGHNVRARARGAAEMDLALAEGWRELGALLEEQGPIASAERCSEEFMRLFVGPRIPEMTPCESYYRTGKVYDEPLALVREFMQRVGLERADNVGEPEDHIAFEMEVMRYLISRQESSKDPDAEAGWLALQGEFFRRHLGVWAPAFFGALEANATAPFYRTFALIGRGFLAWEAKTLKGWGPSAEELAIPVLGAKGKWKGPLFDPEGSMAPPKRTEGHEGPGKPDLTH